MPDHIHMLITPGDSTSLEKAVQLIKGGSSHRIHKERGQKMEIWQVGFRDWTIRDEEDWHSKVEYIHMNPVRARLVVRPGDWLYSSATGRYAMDPVPERYSQIASGAKAPNKGEAETRGLKPPPPEESRRAETKSPLPEEQSVGSSESGERGD